MLSAKPLRLSTASPTFAADLQARLHVSHADNKAISGTVEAVLLDVKTRGDAAVLEYTARWDGVTATSMGELELTQSELKSAYESLEPALREALSNAASRIKSYHEAQKKASGESWQYRDADGTLLGQKVTPLDRVGIYVPGGKATYPSSDRKSTRLNSSHT